MYAMVDFQEAEKRYSSCYNCINKKKRQAYYAPLLHDYLLSALESRIRILHLLLLCSELGSLFEPASCNLASFILELISVKFFTFSRASNNSRPTVSNSASK